MKNLLYKLILIIPVISLCCCKSEKTRQKDWIYSTLEKELWDKISFDAVNESFAQLTDAMKNYSENRVKSYRTETDRMFNDTDIYSKQILWSFVDLQASLGEEDLLSKNRREKKRVISKYMQHCFRIDTLFYYSYTENLDSLKDCVITDVPEPFSTDRICHELLGKPDSYSEPSLERISEMTEANVKNILKYLERPKISATAYDDMNSIWTVRVDGDDNQYIKFYKRDDGTYDIEVSEELNNNRIGPPEFTCKSVKL